MLSRTSRNLIDWSAWRVKSDSFWYERPGAITWSLNPYYILDNSLIDNNVNFNSSKGHEVLWPFRLHPALLRTFAILVPADQTLLPHTRYCHNHAIVIATHAPTSSHRRRWRNALSGQTREDEQPRCSSFIAIFTPPPQHIWRIFCFSLLLSSVWCMSMYSALASTD